LVEAIIHELGNGRYYGFTFPSFVLLRIKSPACFIGNMPTVFLLSFSTFLQPYVLLPQNHSTLKLSSASYGISRTTLNDVLKEGQG